MPIIQHKMFRVSAPGCCSRLYKSVLQTQTRNFANGVSSGANDHFRCPPPMSPKLASSVTDLYKSLYSGKRLELSSVWSKRNAQFSINKPWIYTATRLMHNDKENDMQRVERILPPLMPLQPIVWPKFMNALRNWFFINFIIKPYFDKEFSITEFIQGAKQAASIVANKLSEGKLDDLEGLVDPSALVQIKESLSRFTVFQQQLLRVAAEDVFFAFPYQIGIIIPDEVPSVSGQQYVEGETQKKVPQTRHVEITVCLHVLRGFAEKQKSGETGANFNFHEFSQDERNKYNVMICNYRFFKDFTEGNPDPSWIINMVNHFLPAEVNRF